MLSLESLTTATDLVAILADKGVALTVADGSPIVDAVAATRAEGGDLTCLGDLDKLPLGLYEGNKPRMIDGQNSYGEPALVMEDNLHSSYMDAAGNKYGAILARNVAHTTTVVLPAVSELHDEIKNSLDLELNHGLRSFSVEMVTGSPLLDVADIVNKIEAFSSVRGAVRELPLVLDYPQLSDDALVGLMKIGSEAYDSAVDQFIAQADMANVREVWEVVFAGNRGMYKSYDSFRADPKKGSMRNFAVFLIASRLSDGGEGLPIGTGLSGLSGNRYKMELASLREVSGVALNAQLNFQRNNEKIGKLIDKVDGKTVFVNKVVYDRFMAEGGDIETILGAAVSGDKKVNVSDIIENVEKFKRAWSYHTTIAKQTAADSTLIDVRRVISTFVRNYIRTCDDPAIKQCADGIMDFTGEWVAKLTTPAIKSVDMLAMRAVCEILFTHTDADKILRGVNEAMAANSDITKEDALNLAVYAYVGGWIASHIKVDRA